jgi:hypothetical protein
MRPWFERAVLISDARKVFESDGRVADAATRQRIRPFVEGFAAFAAAQRGLQHQRVSIAPMPQQDIRPHGLIASSRHEGAVTTS